MKRMSLCSCLFALFLVGACNSGSPIDEEVPKVYDYTEVQEVVKNDALVLDGDWICAQADGYLIAQSRVGEDPILCGPVSTANRCTATQACVPFVADIMTMSKALIVGQSFDLARDCAGNCGPISATSCAVEDDGIVQPDGNDFVGRWMCLAFVDSTTDTCTMQAIQFPCGENEQCEETGSYPYWGLCVEQYECQDDADCPASGNQCAPYQCNNNGFCELVILDGQPCDDVNACTENDTCNGSNCEGTTVNCADENVCTDDSCDVVLGCQHVNNTASCNDFSLCTTDDVCANGACSGTPVSCDDEDVCTTEWCDAILGCQTLFNTEPCDDADLCTTDDTCDGYGLCMGTPVDVDDANECTEDTCDPLTGLPINDPASLNGEFCGVLADSDKCIEGLCVDLWCDAPEALQCMQLDALLGLYECQEIIDDGLGEWIETEHCGPITGFTCYVPEGCQEQVNPTSEAGLCADGNDNDGDGDIDCADADCAADPACDVCTPDCDTEVCGPDGCGGSCGVCLVGETCDAAGQCIGCTPDCEGRECGSDGCGGSCGACDAGDTCDATGTCVALAADLLDVTYVLDSADVPAKEIFELMVFCTDAGGSTIISWGVKDTSLHPGVGNLLLQLVDEPATGLYDCHVNVRGRDASDGPGAYWWAASCASFPEDCIGLGDLAYSFGGHAASTVGIQDNTNQPPNGKNFYFSMDDYDGDGILNGAEVFGCEYNPDPGCGLL